MRWSHYFLPLIQQTSLEHPGASNNLIWQAGLAHITETGHYIWLPLGLRILEKLENIVRIEQTRAGYHPFRLSATSPINDQLIDLFNTYKQLLSGTSMRFFNIAWQSFDAENDECSHHDHTEHHCHDNNCNSCHDCDDTSMDAKEILIMEGYSFDAVPVSALTTYEELFYSYVRLFLKMGLTVIPVNASEDDDGILYHQLYALSDNGEYTLYYDPRYDRLADTHPLDFNELLQWYAATEESHKLVPQSISTAQLVTKKANLVGYISMEKPASPWGDTTDVPHVGCHSLEISKLIDILIEANHDDKGIIWPESIAPFHVLIIDLDESDNATTSMGGQLHRALCKAGIEVLYDDRNVEGAAKLAAADLVGIPYQIMIDTHASTTGLVTLKHRSTGHAVSLTLDQVIHKLTTDTSL